MSSDQDAPGRRLPATTIARLGDLLGAAGFALIPLALRDRRRPGS